jgi:hypothetical protein
MKKCIQFIFVIILLSTSILTSQVRKIVLLEEATNASCTPCAANNPTLQEFFESYYGGVISVRYHAWWPGVDPMYSLNTADSENRINYYGINGVPNYLIDGTNHGVPGNGAAMYNQMLEGLALQSPVKIYIDAAVTSDSVYGMVAIKAFDNVNQPNLRLRIAVIERMIVYGSPPGTNGEKIFPDVMRKMVPDGNGTSIASISNGDSLTFNFSTPTDAQWKVDDLSVVAFLQSDASKEVIQSNIDHATYIIETQDNLLEFVDQNQTYSKSCYIVNDNEATLNIRLKTKLTELPGDWTHNFVYNSTNYDSVDVNLAPGDTLYFGIVLNTGNEQSTGQSKLQIIAQYLSDPYNYGFSIIYSALQKVGDVLLVDADGGTSGQSRYATSISNAGYDHTLFDKSIITQVPDQILNLNYNSIFWANGWAFPAFEISDITFLKEFLDNGGNLFIGGQDIGWDIFDPSGSSTFQEAKNFYHMYMDAIYISDNSLVNFGEGIPGTLGEGIFFRINAISGSLYPEVIRSHSGMGDSLFFYQGTTKVGALAFEGATFKTVYLGIGLEQVSDPSARDTLVARALRWFEQPVVKVADEERILPVSFQLQQNFPNPFNPSTIIKYSVPNTEHVKIKVFDVTGSEVAVLVDAIKNPGNYQVEFDASLLSSGLYIYTLKAGEFTQPKKMLLMK